MIAERLQPQTAAYEIHFDRKKGLKKHYLSKQIDTYIGERLNVLLSKSRYEIKNGLIYGEDINEPFLDVIKRGVNYREKAEGKNRVDKKREEAEAEGFLKTQEIICNPNTPVGTMMLSISPKGDKDSLYQRNFYDIFTLKEENGKKFVEARRYSSALNIEEYKDKLKSFVSMKYIFDAGDFLKNPIKIDDVFFANADQIHSYLHREHQVVDFDRFEEIKKTYEALKQEYIENPDPKTLDAIKNKADEKAGLSHYDNTYYYSDFVRSKIPLTVNQEIDYYGGRKVREVATGCGSSGSSSNIFNSESKISSPFSVSEFGMKDDLGEREFDCPACGHINRRPRNEKISRCQNENCPDPTKVAC